MVSFCVSVELKINIPLLPSILDSIAALFESPHTNKFHGLPGQRKATLVYTRTHAHATRALVAPTPTTSTNWPTGGSGATEQAEASTSPSYLLLCIYIYIH